MSIEDTPGVGGVEGLGDDRAETRHGDQVHLVAEQYGGQGLGVSDPVEARPEAAPSSTVHELDCYPVAPSDVERVTGAIRGDQTDRYPRIEHRPQDRTTP